MLAHQTFLERLWVALSSTDPSPPRDIPVVTSLCYYSLTFLIGRLLRHIVNDNTAQCLRPYLLDLVTTFTMMACSLENMHIRTHYGSAGYIAVMFIVAMWYILTIKEGKSNPCAHVVRYMKGQTTKCDFLLRVMVQITGALLSYKYARLFWSLGVSEVHRRRYLTMHCTSDLRIAAPLGFGVEFSGTLLDCVLSLTTFTPFLVCEMATKCLLGSVLTLCGVHLTGFYLNPVNATNQTFGCHGASLPEFLLVYWVAPISATVIGVQLHSTLLDIGQVVRTGKPKHCEVCGKIHNSVVDMENSNAKASEYLETVAGVDGNATKRREEDLPRESLIEQPVDTGLEIKSPASPRKRK